MPATTVHHEVNDCCTPRERPSDVVFATQAPGSTTGKTTFFVGMEAERAATLTRFMCNATANASSNVTLQSYGESQGRGTARGAFT